MPQRTFAKTNQYPVALSGFQPGAYFLLARITELEVEHCFTGLGSRFKFYHCHTVAEDVETRCATDASTQRFAVYAFAAVIGTIGFIQHEFTIDAATHRHAIFIEEAQCDYRAGLAVGDQVRQLRYEFNVVRRGGIMNGTHGTADFLAVGVTDD